MGRPKALLPHADPHTTFLAHLIRAARTGGAGPIFVVGRPGDLEVQAEAEHEGASFVLNPRADDGQLSSVLAGLHAAVHSAPDLKFGLTRTDLAGVLVTPVDVPLVTSSVIARLIQCTNFSDALIFRATHAGRHGHPVLFMRAVFQDLRDADPSIGAKSVLHRHPGRVLDVEVDDAGVTMDVDTLADYERMFGGRIEP